MTQNNPLISIIMPAYNAEKTIRDSIESILIQSYQNWELIVINDCSEDNTYAVILETAKKDCRIRTLDNPCNSGVSESRNLGIAAAQGVWIAFLDSDDIWKSDKLEKQVSLITEKKDADIVFTGSAFIDGLGKQSAYFLVVPSKISYHGLLKQNLISCSSVLVKKALVVKYPMKHDEMHEDYAVWLQILKNGGHAYGINEPLLLYRLSNDSKSSNKIKAARMTYKVYRHMGLSYFQSLYYFSWYTWRSLRKYYNIQTKKF